MFLPLPFRYQLTHPDAQTVPGKRDCSSRLYASNKVAFKESGSIVIMKGATTGDILSEIEPLAAALKRFRRGNRAYASHTAADTSTDASDRARMRRIASMT